MQIAESTGHLLLVLLTVTRTSFRDVLFSRVLPSGQLMGQQKCTGSSNDIFDYQTIVCFVKNLHLMKAELHQLTISCPVSCPRCSGLQQRPDHSGKWDSRPIDVDDQGSRSERRGQLRLQVRQFSGIT